MVTILFKTGNLYKTVFLEKIIILLLVSLNSYSNVVSVKSFGAVGNGVSDDLVFINSATQSMKDGDTLTFEANKNYLVSGKISIGVSCIVFGNNATITPMEGFMRAGGTCLSIGKGISNTIVRGISAIKASTTLNLPPNIIVKKGDLIQFLSEDIWYAFRPELSSSNYIKGQYAIVTSIQGTNLTISSPFFDNFNISTIAVFKGCDATKVTGLNFNLSKQPNTQNPVTGLAIRGTNIIVESCIFTGNEYAFCAIQVDGENAVIKHCMIRDFFNIQGFSGGRLGYGINATCNNTTVLSNTIINCKHGFTSAARKFVVANIKILRNLFIEDSSKAIATTGGINPQLDYAGTIDVHGGVSKGVLISENIIHSQGRAIFIRNGSAVISNNKIYQLRNPVGLIGLEERPIDNLLIEGNNFQLFNGAANVLGKYLSLASDPGYLKNTIVKDNACANDWIFYNNSCKFNIDGLAVENNLMKNCKDMYLVKFDSLVTFNNIKKGNNTVGNW